MSQTLTKVLIKSDPTGEVGDGDVAKEGPRFSVSGSVWGEWEGVSAKYLKFFVIRISLGVLELLVKLWIPRGYSVYAWVTDLPRNIFG